MEMGRYCKAYHARMLRDFSGWSENLANLRPEKRTENGRETEVPRSALADDDILYLQENYIVTDGIFKDENVVFEAVTEEWKRFCAESLDFRIPEYAAGSGVD